MGGRLNEALSTLIVEETEVLKEAEEAVKADERKEQASLRIAAIIAIAVAVIALAAMLIQWSLHGKPSKAPAPTGASAVTSSAFINRPF